MPGSQSLKVQNSSFFPKQAFLAELKKHRNLSKENLLGTHLRYLDHDFPVRMEAVFDKNTSSKTKYSKWSKDHFLPNRPVSWADETHVSLERNPCVSEAGAPGTLFPWENSDTFGKESFLQLWFLKVELASDWSKKAYDAKLKKHMYVLKEKHLTTTKTM